MSSTFSDRGVPLSNIWRTESTHSATEEAIEQPQSLTDEEAMMRLKTRDRAALAILFERYSRLVFTIAFRILHDYGEAEDLVQSLYLSLYQNSELYDAEKGSAKTWITQRAYSRALDRRDYLVRRQTYPGTDSGVQPDLLAGDFDLERIIGSKLLRERILEAFRELPEKQSLTLKLYFFEGLELRDIGERIGDPITHVRHHYYRGLDKLRQSAFVRGLRDRKL